MVHIYKIAGGQPVSGNIKALGAKNFATKAMVASILAEGTTTLINAPNIGDVSITTDMLNGIGVETEWKEENALSINTQNISNPTVPLPDSGSNRIPILLLGALLNRSAEAHVPTVAGCNIGERPVDFHLNAIEMFGAKVDVNEKGYHAYRNGQLKACHYKLPFPSVGATETCLLLGSKAKGTSVIENVAIEPEIVSLITMLNSMGARIDLNPNRQLTIKGVEEMAPTNYHVLGDRIEVASWAALAAATDGSITVEGIDPSTLINFFGPFNSIGGGVRIEDKDTITFFRRENSLSSTVIETDVYPGFATDWQQPFALMLSQADGVSVIHDTVYEKRFGYLNDLKKLGVRSQIVTKCLGSVPCRFNGHDHQHSALITGASKLESKDQILDVPDLRAGLAYVMAAALAEGETTLTSIERIERGYGDLPVRTSGLSLDIKKLRLN